MTNRLRVVIVDDHPLFREGVVHTLRGAPVLDIVGEGETAEDAVRIAQEQLPDIILLDVNMPGGGIAAARAIVRACPSVKVLMLTISESEEDVVQALEAGAKAYVFKGTSGSELLKIMFAVSRGETYVTAGLAARLLTHTIRRELAGSPLQSDTAGAQTCGTEYAPTRARVLPDLTERETQILAQVTRGLTNKEIARTLSLSEKTVKHHMTNVMQKLHVRNRVEAAMVFRKQTQPR